MKRYHKNPRQITKKQRADLSRWLRELGDLSGVVHDLNSGEIIGGNMRGDVFNINECEITYTVQYDEPDHQGTVALGYVLWHDALYNYREVRWTPEKCEQGNIVANKAGGTFDFDILANEFEQVKLLDWGFEPFELGIEPPEPESQDAEPQTNRADELREEWGVELGQMWRLPSRVEGQEHRLICGDCTDEAVVKRVMGGDKADMVFTDPPYNVAYQDNESLESLKKRNRRQDGLIVENDSKTDEEFMLFLIDVFSSFPLKDGGAYYVCAPPGRTETQFRNALDSTEKMGLRECIVWVKDVFVFGRQDYHWRHESILYGWREGASHYFVGDRTQDTVWEIVRPKVSEFHPTMKPVELIEKGIKNSSRVEEIIYEPFSGSGTTIIAAENLSRQCRAVEIAPGYVAVALDRYWRAFNIKPELIK